MTVYIEEGAWASCSFDLAGSPQQLVLQSDRRVVGYVGQYRLLTIDDRATKEKFSCKLIAKQWGGLFALVGGIVLGVAAVAVTGPVGWVAIAAVTVVAVAEVAAVVAVNNHDCSDPLKNGEWVQFHTTVHIQGRNAVLYNRSQLACSNKGILVASETQAAAQELSEAMQWNALIEVGVQILSNALIGFITGYGVIDKKADGDVDLDLASVPLGIVSYYYTDFKYWEFTPEKSLGVSVASAVIGYGLGEMNRLPGLGWSKGWLGTEVTDPKDWLTTKIVAGVGYVADNIELKLTEANERIINNAADRSSAASGKTIISLED